MMWIGDPFIIGRIRWEESAWTCAQVVAAVFHQHDDYALTSFTQRSTKRDGHNVREHCVLVGGKTTVYIL